MPVRGVEVPSSSAKAGKAAGRKACSWRALPKAWRERPSEPPPGDAAWRGLVLKVALGEDDKAYDDWGTARELAGMGILIVSGAGGRRRRGG